MLDYLLPMLPPPIRMTVEVVIGIFCVVMIVMAVVVVTDAYRYPIEDEEDDDYV